MRFSSSLFTSRRLHFTVSEIKEPQDNINSHFLYSAVLVRHLTGIIDAPNLSLCGFLINAVTSHSQLTGLLFKAFVLGLSPHTLMIMLDVVS